MGPVKLISPRRHTDSRGWFSETYNGPAYEQIGIGERFVQDNHAHSITSGTLRGLHFQAPPYAQAKLVWCPKGRIWDVAVDLRRQSPTFGRWVGAELSALNGLQIFIPVGFAHGYVTLEADTEVVYKVSHVFAPACEGGVVWNDETLAVAWPLTGAPRLSDKDRCLPSLAQVAGVFAYDGEPLSPLDADPLTP